MDAPLSDFGLQVYAMSRYPGEHRLVQVHPADDGELWYRRSEVDSKLAKLRAENVGLKAQVSEYKRTVSEMADRLRERGTFDRLGAEANR